MSGILKRLNQPNLKLIFFRLTAIQKCKRESISESISQIMTTKLNWAQTISEAEKIVGYPTPFLALHWLLSDEVAKIAINLRKLAKADHPLLKTAK